MEIDDKLASCGCVGGARHCKDCDSVHPILFYCGLIHSCRACAKVWGWKFCLKAVALLMAFKGVPLFITLTQVAGDVKSCLGIKAKFSRFLDLRIGNLDTLFKRGLQSYIDSGGLNAALQRRLYRRLKVALRGLGRDGLKVRDLFVKGYARLEVKRRSGGGVYHFHIHTLCRAICPIPQCLLAELWRIATGGIDSVVHITLIKNVDNIARYIAKYVSKSEGDGLSKVEALEVDRVLSGKQKAWQFGSGEWVTPALEALPCAVCGSVAPMEYLGRAATDEDGKMVPYKEGRTVTISLGDQQDVYVLCEHISGVLLLYSLNPVVYRYEESIV